MVSFRKCLENAIHSEWSSHYINYVQLKFLSQELAVGNTKDYFGEAEKVSSSHDGFKEREEMCKALDDELFKVQVFSMTRKRDLQKRIQTFDDKVYSTPIKEEDLEELKLTFIQLVNDVIEFDVFIGVNTISLYHLLIRYDAMARLLNWAPLGQWYIVTRRGGSNGHLLDALDRKLLLKIEGDLLTSGDLIMNDSMYIQNIRSQLNMIHSIITDAEEKVKKVVEVRGHYFTDNVVGFLVRLLTAGSSVTHVINARTMGNKLHRHIQFFSEWKINDNGKYTLIQPGETDPNAYNDMVTSTGMKDILTSSLVLILLSQLLYMMNHYIVEPSSVQYIHELGGNDALAGLLIGCAPWAALFSAFIYSLWSNHSFKQPLLCSACFLFAGSFMYANALRFDSITMAMIGRVVTGLGAPCGISIRYIADTITHSHRTAMSSLFVMVGAIGMSGGPGLAILLDFFHIDVHVPFFGRFLFNGMTGPGYLMSLLWFVYGIALLLYFEDGDRIGISERSGDNELYSCCEHYTPPTNKASLLNDSRIDERTIDSTYSSMSMDVPFDFEQLGHNTRKKNKWLLNEATIVCMALKFFSKFCLEILGCSVSIITIHRYGWSVKMIGLIGLVNGLLVIPISAGVGWLSLYYTDKTLLVALLGVAFIGVILLIDFTDFNVENSTDEYYNEGKLFAVGEKRYILGIILEFCGFQASQSIVLSLLSKVVPLELAKGTFNSGFIATTAITLSRALGDTFITMMGYVSIRSLLNLLSVPALLLSGFSIMLSIFHSRKLSV